MKVSSGGALVKQVPKVVFVIDNVGGHDMRPGSSPDDWCVARTDEEEGGKPGGGKRREQGEARAARTVLSAATARYPNSHSTPLPSASPYPHTTYTNTPSLWHNLFHLSSIS